MSEDTPRSYPRRARDEGAPPEQDFADELNPDQLAAATHGDGSLLIIAGAGTGKTRTLVYRVAHLIRRGVRPDRILLLTFTRRAAQEMLSRAERLTGSASGRVHGGTFHATANRLLRRFGPAAGLPSDFTIMDQGDATDLMQLSRANLGYARKDARFPKKETLHWIYSRHINTGDAVADIVRSSYPQFAEDTEAIIRVYADYTDRKAKRNLVDYDDLLLFWALMLETSPELAERISGLYQHLLIDEYQDTNLLQARILRGMCRGHTNITVVGDDAQSIYAFRGASFRNILDFPKQFPDTTVVMLEQNYRSTPPILEVTNELISRAPERYTKTLWTTRAGGEAPWLVTVQDETQQTRFVVDRILELHEEGIALGRIAVLFRAAYMSADLEIELANRQIPFEKWGGLKFLEAAHVKDVLAFLRLAENPRDEVSWHRVLMLLPGVGEATANTAIEALARADWAPDTIRTVASRPRAAEAYGTLADVIARLRAASPQASAATDGEAAGPLPPVSGDIALIRTLYDGILKAHYDNSEPRLADLEQLQVIAGGYPDRATFLAALALEPPQATQDLAGGSPDNEDDTLVLSTVHSAKGKEWDAVFLIWVVDGWFPSTHSLGNAAEIEEERRLMYVALTRARNHLAVTYPLNAYSTRRGSEYSIDQLSRFIDAGVRAKMQRVVIAADVAPPVEGTVPTGAPTTDLRALLRGRFTAG